MICPNCKKEVKYRTPVLIVEERRTVEWCQDCATDTPIPCHRCGKNEVQDEGQDCPECVQAAYEYEQEAKRDEIPERFYWRGHWIEDWDDFCDRAYHQHMADMETVTITTETK